MCRFNHFKVYSSVALSTLTLLSISPPSISRTSHHSKLKLGTHQTLTPRSPFLPILNPFFLPSLPPFYSPHFGFQKWNLNHHKFLGSLWNLALWLLPTTKLTSGLPWWLSGKASACQCRFDPWVRNTPWRKRQPTPVFPRGKSHDRAAWRATVHGVGKSRTRLSD